MKCFIIALFDEAKPIIEKMTYVESYTEFEKKIYEGILCGERVAIILSDVGKVNAAMATTYAIMKFTPECIINIGTAGGLNENCKVAEIYAVSKAVQFDFDLCQLNGTEIGTLNEFKKNYLPLNTVEGFKKLSIGTSDRFNDSLDDFVLLTKVLNADLRDMECGAIAQVCAHTDTPFYAFKGVSDVAASGSTTEQFLRNMEACKQAFSNSISQILYAINND